MKKYLVFFFMSISMLGIVINTHSYTSGSDVGFTKSPGDGGIDCAYCHKDPVAPSDQLLKIFSNIPESGWKKDSLYDITIELHGQNPLKENANIFGFLATVEKSSDHRKYGAIWLTDPKQTQIKNNYWITHKSAGTKGDTLSKSWTFQWKAPAFGLDSMEVWASGNIANGNSYTGDVIISNHNKWKADSGFNTTGLNTYGKINGNDFRLLHSSNTYWIQLNKENSFEQYAVYTLEGKLLEQGKIRDGSLQTPINIDFQGIKILQLISKNQSASKKFY